MSKLPITLGILAWKSGQTLVDTLTTYFERDLPDMVNEILILFQECSEEDRYIANYFGVDYIPLETNIGIGRGFIRLAESSTQPYFITLEHDWKLIEDYETTYERLTSGIDLIESGMACIRYRHRKYPGDPHFSFRHRGNELNYYDAEIECTSPHLLDAVHWTDHPEVAFAPHIQKTGDYYTTTSRHGNWTNNPCMYRPTFYLEVVKPMAGDGIQLEGNISRWWAQQQFGVAHGEGLFTHIDRKKYG